VAAFHRSKNLKVWRRASQNVGELGAEGIAATFGNYVVALASVGRLSDMKKALEEWGWALELVPDAATLTYAVLSLFDERHLEKAIGHLPKHARDNLPKLADAFYDAAEVGLYAIEPEVVKLAVDRLMRKYGEDVVKILFEATPISSKLFLFALVGLAHCRMGMEWGLKLAKEAARTGLRYRSILGYLFGELYKALEGATVGNCVTEEVLEAVYKLYYLHI